MVDSDVNTGSITRDTTGGSTTDASFGSQASYIVSNLPGKLLSTSLVEIKNGRVVFKQKSSSFEKLSVTLQEIVKFRQMLESRIESQDPPLTALPDEHKPLIAKLAHESDKTIAALAKHIQHELLPTQDEDEDGNISSASLSALPLQVVEDAIKSVMNRNNYGLDGIPGSGKVPAAMCVWRWEVKDQYFDWLPNNSREKAEARLVERIQAKKDLKILFESLSQEARDAIVDPKGGSKLSGKEKHKNNTTSTANLAGEADCSSKKQSIKQQKQRSGNEGNENQSEEQLAPGRQQNFEKAAKEKEKQEKKHAKAEKEKRAKEAELKSRSLLANFFGKAKTVNHASSLESGTAVAEASSSRSDFEKLFKPFVLKKDTDLAPINWFASAKRNGPADGKVVIVIDDDIRVVDIETRDDRKVDVDVSAMNARERLHSILSSLPPSADPFVTSRPLTRPPSDRIHPCLTVRDIFNRLTEAEVAGDVSLVRALLSRLRDRRLIPAKVLIFEADARPGYFGTWTRFSDIIGPRTPFAKDFVLDYSYDSGEEWEAEGTGEADDVVEDEEDEDVDAEDADSDLDSWLDDDVVQDDETPLGTRCSSPSILLPAPQKRKSENGDQKLGKKRKVIVPLAPFAKGPCWESTIGRCDYDLFKPYQIHLFNDTPLLPVDPFTFVSTPAQACAGDSSDTVFAVPSLPERLISSTSAPGPIPGPGKRVPKTSFPEAHLPLLLTKISSLATGSIAFLVESIYQELAGQNVKKNAIEAKVKEVGERCREKKIWVVKSEVVS